MSSEKKNNLKYLIGQNIRKIRRGQGISQDRLSKLADLSLNTIVNIESGANINPTIYTLNKIANALGVTVDDLMR